MKKILFTISLLSIVSFTSPVFAQQQINNDGANASDLQQQTGSENIQQNTNSQQASDVSQNAGASVLQNAPNQPLDVVGAPANSAVDDAEKDTKWVILFVILFAILIGPAVVYLREMQVAEQVSNNAVEKSKDVTNKVVAADANQESSKKTTEKKPKTGAKKKNKKGTVNKSKRAKKKK